MATTSNSYTGNNSTVDYSFTFPYLNTTDIKVSLDGSATTAYTLHNATTIRFNSAPGQGKAIKIYRDTDSSKLPATFYPGSAIRSTDLNDNYTQNLYVTQEAENDVIDANTTAASAVTTANSANTKADGAVTTANSASTAATNAVNTANTASTNASSAVTTANSASTDAANAVSTANTASSNATTAVNTANAATSTANTASSTATTASNNATTAVNTANAATSTANTAATNAANALSTANSAQSNATSAVSTANAADTAADAAKLSTDRLVAVTSDNGASWTLKGNNTNSSTDPKGVGYAVTTSESANTTASTASTNATAALNNSRESDGSGGYTSAISVANTSKTAADTAKDATDKVVATFNSNNNTWTLQGNNTNAATDPKGVGYAVTQAEAAVVTANSASATVANSAIYQVVANYAALPTISSSNHGDFYQITDSSAVSRSSGTFSPTTVSDPLSVAPNDFTGDNELTVKLKANNTSGKWEWQEYYSNDPETRYRKKLIIENKIVIDEDYTIATGNNAFSLGPISVAAGKVVTVPANSIYHIWK